MATASERNHDRGHAPCVVCGKATKLRDSDDYPYCPAHMPDEDCGLSATPPEKPAYYVGPREHDPDEHGGESGGA